MNKFVFLFASIVAILIMGSLAVAKWYSFDNNCGDYLKLAADAPNVQRAEEFLGKAISYIEEKGLTNGHTAIVFDLPGNDLALWYGNLFGARTTLKQILEREVENLGSVSQLEKDNALMKVREVLLDHGKEGTIVTLPDWISWHPNQGVMLIGVLLCILLIVFTLFLWITD